MKWSILLLSFIFCFNSYAKDLGFALSGGISLGIYEAGVFYSVIQKNKDTIAQDTKVVYGTSAGGINSLLGVFDICGFEKLEKESSLFWRFWIPNGLKELQSHNDKEISLLSRASSEAMFKVMRKRWREGFRPECDLHFGVAVSRKEPYVQELKEGLEIIRQAEFFSVRIRGQGRGRPPLVENQMFANDKTFRTSLPLGEDPDKDLEILHGLIQASSAFPMAFEPYPISFCYSKPGEPIQKCNSRSAQTELFIDGGLYHNGPVGFAFDMLKSVSRDKDFQLYYINASAPLIRQKKEEAKKIDESGALDTFQQVFRNLVVQARKYELVKSLESNPGIVKHLNVPLKHYPLISDPLYAFNGFIEKDFRKADFYAGIYDAGPGSEEDPEYNCYRSYLDGEKSDCLLNKNLRILVDLSKYRMSRDIVEGDFDKIYAYLEKNKFEFKDMGLKASESRYARVYVKDKLTRLVKNFADKQPKDEQKRIKHFIRPGLNYLQYTPLKDFWFASYGSSGEVGYSTVIPEKNFVSTAFRFNAVMGLGGLSNFFSRARDIWALTPLIGAEYEPLWLNGPILQWRVGARVGYSFSPSDDWGTGTCDTELLEEYASACSGATGQMTFSLSVVDRLRLQLVYVPFLINSTSFNEKPELLVQIGFQFGDAF